MKKRLIEKLKALRQLFVTRSKGKRCQCTFCKIHPYLKWATVMECKCGCHTGDGMTGHDGLCCSLPNVLKKNNPYKNLEKAEVYQKRINDYFGDEC
jgi:hypothetical protein